MVETMLPRVGNVRLHAVVHSKVPPRRSYWRICDLITCPRSNSFTRHLQDISLIRREAISHVSGLVSPTSLHRQDPVASARQAMPSRWCTSAGARLSCRV